jgi:hypothetical protein
MHAGSHVGMSEALESTMDARQFTGGPPSTLDRLRGIFAPRGGAVADGARLAAVNIIGLIVALILLAIVTVVARILDLILPVPVTLLSLAALAVLVAFAVYVAWRYAREYGRAARASGREIRADLFGAIGALPYAAISLMLFVFGLFGFLLSIITVSGDRALDSLQRLGFGLLFLLLAAAIIVVSRSASDANGRMN